MEFWGLEVKPGKPLKVTPEAGKLIHISQASLGELKDVKAAKNVPLRLKIDGKSFVFGYLSAEGTTQIIVDLVFEKEFELSHDLKNGTVYFLGYTADEQLPDDEDFSEFDDDSEDELVDLKENGNAKPNAGDIKAAQSILAAAAAGNAKAEAKKDGPAEPDDDDDEEDEDSSESDGEMALDGLPQVDSSDEDDSLDDDSSDEEELPKVQQSKKRPIAIEQKGPASKKAKSAATPGNSGKKGQTPPIPSKAAGNKSKEQTPKSAGNKSKDQTPKSRNKGKQGGK